MAFVSIEKLWHKRAYCIFLVAVVAIFTGCTIKDLERGAISDTLKERKKIVRFQAEGVSRSPSPPPLNVVCPVK